MSQKSVEVLDTTLRDGAQTVNVSFTLNDKLRLAQVLDELGVDYIEGGWPGSNPKDEEFFNQVKKLSLVHSKVAAFGSTKKSGSRADEDPSLKAIARSGAEVAVVFGKTWILHVDQVLKVSRQENLDLIHDSLSYLKSLGLKVIFDAEHFYQGFGADREYALEALKVAEEAKVDVITLADTNGGTLPSRVYEVTKMVRERIKSKLGIHAHNDLGCGVANTLMGVMAGARHIQGTINGLGERTGNADLVQVIPTLVAKLGLRALKGRESLKMLRNVSRLVSELAGLPPNPYQPYIGDNAFTHKAGVHVDAVLKNTSAYEHIDPQVVGNTRSVAISELSGTANLVTHATNILGIEVKKSDERLKRALAEVKRLEKAGYSFDSSPASALLILMRSLGIYRKLIDMQYWKVISETGTSIGLVKANSRLRVAEGKGPINAVDLAIRAALLSDYPELSKITLVDYKVVLPGEVKNTESMVRVTVEFADESNSWRTMGVSANVIEASVKALVDGLDFFLQTRRIAKGATVHQSATSLHPKTLTGFPIRTKS